jgi:hypothetical protein
MIIVGRWHSLWPAFFEIAAVIPPGHVVALHEYKAQGDLELSLKPGDIIE